MRVDAIDVLARRADRCCGHTGSLRLVEHGVGLGHVGGDLAGEHAARGVGAVAVHRAAEVAQDDLVLTDHAVAGMMVRARCVLARCDDREVHLLVTLLDDPATEVGGDLGLGPADERDLAALQLAGDRVDGRAGSGERIDLGLVLGPPQRTDDVDRTGVLGAGQVREQFDEEAGPHLVTDSDPLRTCGQLAGDRRRVVGLAPWDEVEHAGLLGDPGSFELGNQQ